MFENMGGREFEIAGTRFQINKLEAMEAWSTLEMLRPILAGIAERSVGSLKVAAMQYATGEDTDQVAIKIGLMLAQLPAITMEGVRQKLFQGVKFTNAQIQTPRVLLGNEEAAFQDAEGLAIGEVIVRAFAANFMSSWAGIESLLPDPPSTTSQ